MLYIKNQNTNKKLLNTLQKIIKSVDKTQNRHYNINAMAR